MAALSEAEVRKILGGDMGSYLKTMDHAAGIETQERSVRNEIDKLEGHKFNILALVLVGAALIMSAVLTTRGNQFWIQSAIGLLLIIAGAAWMVQLWRRLPELRTRPTQLHAQHR